MVFPDGTSRPLQLGPGAVAWVDRAHYAIENVSDQPVEHIELELKGATAPAVVSRRVAVSTRPTEPMPAAQEPHHRLRYEKQYVRVLEVTLEPGESSLFHTHNFDVLYVILADAVARGQMLNEDWVPETAFKSGAITFDEASKHPFTHHLKNIGGTTFHTLNIEIL